MENVNNTIKFDSEDNKQKSPADILWEKAVNLSDGILPGLETYKNELFSTVQNMRSQLGIPSFKIEEAETDYWRVSDKVQILEEEISKILSTLSDFSEGKVNETKLREMLPQEEKDLEKLSKRKKAIIKEEDRLKEMGIDSREVAFEKHITSFGADSYRFTTGRHQKKVHGDLDVYSAADDFFYRSTDTHGGKVDHGKGRRDSYYTSGGKRVRKS
jgi:hypothetical protein